MASEIAAKSASRQAREASGKATRESVPREVHGNWTLDHARPAVAERIQQSLQGRILSLIPLRNERMAASPFAFYRGGASVMAFDLLQCPATGLFVQLCGDAHVRNFGTFARFDGVVGFDVNDFDETYRGPFEWDLKRLAASVVLAGREAKHDDRSCKDAVRTCVRTYRQRMRDLAEKSPFEILRKRASRDEHADIVERLLSESKHKSHGRLIDELTEPCGSTRRFKDCPPLVDHSTAGNPDRFAEAIETYRTTLSPAMQLGLEAYRLRDAAFKVVGVGSVGLAAYVTLLATGGDEHYVILQLKQARQSTVEAAMRVAGLPSTSWSHEGQRVIEGQRAMQSYEDPFLGYTTFDSKPFMVRRLAENKATIDDASVRDGGLSDYAKATGTILASSHAATGDPIAIASYLGHSDAFDDALCRFATAYADQAEDDFTQFVRERAPQGAVNRSRAD